IKVLDGEKNGSTHQGYLWAYRDVIRNLVLFEYQRGRNKEGPAKMLTDFKGFLQTDGYAAYDQFYQREGVEILHCMAHARRYFKEAENNDRERSESALKRVQEIEEAERQRRELAVVEGRKLGQEVIVPKLDTLGMWMAEQKRGVTPKSPIGKALGYS